MQHGIEFHTLGTILNNGAETIEDANLYFTCGHFTERHGAGMIYLPKIDLF